MIVPAPFYAVGPHFGIDLDGARVVFTTRRGGVSDGPYASLNLGRWTEDAPEAVERNRARLAGELGVALTYGRQVHGAVVACVDRAPAQDPPPDADGQATATRGVAPMVLTADCLPVAVAGDGAVAMIHAGWRGLAAGVVPAGVAAVRRLGARGSLQAAIGPGAGPCCYEVGTEVWTAFALRGSWTRRGRNLDLKAIARDELERAGVGEINDIALCTICSGGELFFSHRRDGGLTGRQAGVAWLS